MEIEEVVAGVADLAVPEGFFTEEGQSGDGTGGCAGQFQAGLEVEVVDVQPEPFDEDRLGEPAVQRGWADVEVLEGDGDGLVGFENIDEKPELLF